MWLATECAKCGAEIPEGADSCVKCTWPFSLSAWSQTSFNIHRITLDTCCINAKGLCEAINTLELRAQQGFLEIQRSDAMLKELSGKERVAKAEAMAEHPGLFTLNKSALDGPDVLGGSDLQDNLRELLFPTAYPMTENQKYDVEHLHLHVLNGGDIFVTLNPKDFITRGRQEKLRMCGVWVMQPVELVDVLRDLYGWR